MQQLPPPLYEVHVITNGYLLKTGYECIYFKDERGIAEHLITKAAKDRLGVSQEQLELFPEISLTQKLGASHE